MASNYGRGLELLLLPLPYCIAVVDTRFEIVEGDSSILTAALGTIMVACICLQNGMRSEWVCTLVVYSLWTVGHIHYLCSALLLVAKCSMLSPSPPPTHTCAILNSHTQWMGYTFQLHKQSARQFTSTTCSMSLFPYTGAILLFQLLDTLHATFDFYGRTNIARPFSIYGIYITHTHSFNIWTVEVSVQ